MTDFGFFKEFFVNYETTKLHIDNPALLNNSIYFSLLFFALVTLKKKSSNLLDFSQTEQLKGLSVLLVIIQHFWHHICNERDTIYFFGSYAVTLFLLLSGYGLMRSNMTNGINARDFFMKRVKKIFLPYWLVTIAIIAGDYFLWQKQYPLQELLLTFAGINFSTELQYFDHSRWFITLLLINYFAFFCCMKLWRSPFAIIGLLFFSFILIILRHYDLFSLGARHQLLAFPLGCALALMGPIKRWVNWGTRYQFATITLIVLAMFSIYFATIRLPTDIFLAKKIVIYLESYILPYLFCLLCISSISFLASFGYASNFFGLCGYLSYELYLIHGPLLIKYNPIFGNFGDKYILIAIFLWFGMAFGLAYTLKAGAAFSNRFFNQQTI
jgi:probable poly-beta-1,6-N-acetyl-D-glucosamine export protein